jgi:hypothetical protein
VQRRHGQRERRQLGARRSDQPARERQERNRTATPASSDR